MDKYCDWSSLRSAVKASDWWQDVVTTTERLVTELWQQNFGRHVPSTFTTMQVIRCDVFTSSIVASHAFSALCVYLKFGCRPHLLGYPCAKFCFCRGLHCSVSWWRKIMQSITHSLTHSPSLLDALKLSIQKFKVRDNANTDKIRVLCSLLYAAVIIEWHCSKFVSRPTDIQHLAHLHFQLLLPCYLSYNQCTATFACVSLWRAYSSLAVTHPSMMGWYKPRTDCIAHRLAVSLVCIT